MKFPTVDKRYTANGKQVIEVVLGDRSASSCHIADASSPELAARIAKGLGMLEVSEQAPMFTIDPATANFSDLHVRPGRILRVKTTVTLPESEILARAREAAVAVHCSGSVYDAWASLVRDGKHDATYSVLAATRALRDLAKPLSEVVPAVDGDLVEARRIAADDAGAESPIFSDLARRGEHDGHPIVVAALAAIRRGRELEREAR